jgi:hypothetical protein
MAGAVYIIEVSSISIYLISCIKLHICFLLLSVISSHNMSWYKPFRRNDENTIHKWGYTFQWGPQHLTAEEMHPLKYSYDVLGEECLNRLDAISPPATGELPRSRSRVPTKEKAEPAPRRDLYALLRDHASENEKLGELWEEVNTIPEWVDWDQIARGQDVFYRYGGVALTAV